MQDLRQLVVWQKTYQLRLKIYAVNGTFPKCEQSGLTSQMRRAAIPQIFDMLYRRVCGFQNRAIAVCNLLSRRDESGKQENRNGTSTGPVLPAFLFSRFSLRLLVSKGQMHLCAASAAVPALYRHTEARILSGVGQRPDLLPLHEDRPTPDLLSEVGRMLASLIQEPSPDRRPADG